MNTHSYPNPPQLARKLFLWYCADPLKEEIAGDLEERFLDHVEAYGLTRGQAQLLAQRDEVFSMAHAQKKKVWDIHSKQH